MKLSEVNVLLLELTNRCNGNCIMCWHSNKKPFGTWDIDDKLYGEIKEKLFKQIKILQPVGGGEIFLYSKFNEFIKDIKQYKFKTIITSNFADITEEQKLLLKDMNVEFVVSIDGSYKQLQEFLRPGCKYETVIDNIKTFVGYGKKIILQTTVSNYNFYDMANMLELAGKLKAFGVRFQSVQYLNHLDKPYKFEKPPKDWEYLRELNERKFNVKYNITLDYYVQEDNIPCLKTLHPLESYWGEFKNKFIHRYCPNTADILYVQGGRVLSCCLPESKVMGDLRQNSLEEIIGSKKYDENRKKCRCKLIEFSRRKLLCT